MWPFLFCQGCPVYISLLKWTYSDSAEQDSENSCFMQGKNPAFSDSDIPNATTFGSSLVKSNFCAIDMELKDHIQLWCQ